MTPQEYLDSLWKERATAILRTQDRKVAADAMEAAITGGFRVVEFTLNTPTALELIARFSQRPELIVGAGTVLTPDDARRAVDAGARFLVSPVIDAEVIATAHQLEVAVMPGTHTPTEMWTAHQWGAQLQKLFPAPGHGPFYVRSCLGPLPELRIVPTNGVDADNVADWLRAGSFAVGFTTTLFEPSALEERRFDDIAATARTLLEAARSVDRPLEHH